MYKIISTIILFLMMFITHNIYSWIPSNLTAIFFPVNESIMEHMKMISTTYIIYSVVLFFIKKDKFKNYFANYLFSTTITIFIFLLVYLPVYNVFNEVMIFTFIWLFISIYLTSYISIKILEYKNIKYLNIISIIVSIILIFDFIYFTYNPFINSLWYDSKDNIYGIK